MVAGWPLVLFGGGDNFLKIKVPEIKKNYDQREQIASGDAECMDTVNVFIPMFLVFCHIVCPGGQSSIVLS